MNLYLYYKKALTKEEQRFLADILKRYGMAEVKELKE